MRNKRDCCGLQLEAQLSDSCCYFAGGFVQFVLSIWHRCRRATPSPEEAKILSWASVELHGQLHLDPNSLALPQTTQRTGVTSKTDVPHRSPSKPTSLQRTAANLGTNDRLIFTSGLHIFASDVALTPSQMRTFLFKAFLPLDIPTSFSGKHLKVAYWLTISGQEPLHETVSLRIPLRVINPLAFRGVLLKNWQTKERIEVGIDSQETSPRDLSHPFSFQSHGSYLDEHGDISLSVSVANGAWKDTEQKWSQYHESSRSLQRKGKQKEENTFKLHRQKVSQKVLRLGIHALTNQVTQSVAPESFMIARGEQLVGKVYMAKRTFQLGEAIRLGFDFESASVPCYQVLF